MRIAQDLSISRVRKAGKASRSPARPGSPGVDLAGRGWGPTVVARANVAALFPWWRIAAGPCCSQSRLAGKMGVKCPQKGAKWRLLRELATLLVMAQLLYCHSVASIVVEKSAQRQLATTIYSLRTCVEKLVSQILEKAQKRSIS